MPVETTAAVAALFLSAEERCRRGKATFRERAELYNLICRALDAGDSRDAGWHSDLTQPGHPWLQSWMEYVGLGPFDGRVRPEDLEQEMRSRCQTDAVLNFATSKWDASGKCWFSPDDDLTYGLIATEAKGLSPQDVMMPLPAIFVAFPKGILDLYHAITGWHEVRALYLVEGIYRPTETWALRTAGRRLLVICDAEPNAQSFAPLDNMHSYWTIPLHDDSRTIDSLCDDLSEINADPRSQRRAGELDAFMSAKTARICGETVSMGESMQLIQRFALNFLLFLTSGECSTEKAKAPKRKKGRRAHRHPVLTATTVHVRSTVPIDKRLRHLFRSGIRSGNKLTVRTIVRGHIRNQACGPGYKDHKRVWIKPHIRGKDLATALRGHDYAVKER
jgi:hypothetical protein